MILVLLEIGLQAHAPVVAVGGREASSALFRLVAPDEGGVEDEVRVFEGVLTPTCGLEAQVDAHLFDVALGQARDHLQPRRVDVHEDDGRAVEAFL
jgi:hypothetical protein